MSWSLMAIKGLIQIDKMKASFKNESKKRAASPPTLYRVSWVQEKNPWIRDKVRKSEKGSSRRTVTIYQLWKTMTVTNKGTNRCPRVISGINGNII